MLRILRWMVLGLLLVAVVAPAVQAQGGGIDVVTAASSADLDPDGAPAASTASTDPTPTLLIRTRPSQIGDPVVALELPRAEAMVEELSQLPLHFDAAVVTLDLTLTAFEQGDTAAVKRMAEEASILLTRAEAKQEAFAALSLLLRAVDAETLTLATLQQVRGRLAKVKSACGPCRRTR